MTVKEWSALQGFELCGLSSALNDGVWLRGNTLWARDQDGQRIGLAWEWFEMERNVFIMSDPMSILSNVCLVGVEDQRNDFKRTIQLNNMIYRLPWQERLRTKLRPFSAGSEAGHQPRAVGEEARVCMRSLA